MGIKKRRSSACSLRLPAPTRPPGPAPACLAERDLGGGGGVQELAELGDDLGVGVAHKVEALARLAGGGRGEEARVCARVAGWGARIRNRLWRSGTVGPGLGCTLG